MPRGNGYGLTVFLSFFRRRWASGYVGIKTQRFLVVADGRILEVLPFAILAHHDVFYGQFLEELVAAFDFLLKPVYALP